MNENKCECMKTIWIDEKQMWMNENICHKNIDSWPFKNFTKALTAVPLNGMITNPPLYLKMQTKRTLLSQLATKHTLFSFNWQHNTLVSFINMATTPSHVPLKMEQKIWIKSA